MLRAQDVSACKSCTGRGFRVAGRRRPQHAFFVTSATERPATPNNVTHVLRMGLPTASPLGGSTGIVLKWAPANDTKRARDDFPGERGARDRRHQQEPTGSRATPRPGSTDRQRTGNGSLRLAGRASAQREVESSRSSQDVDGSLAGWSGWRDHPDSTIRHGHLVLRFEAIQLTQPCQGPDGAPERLRESAVRACVDDARCDRRRTQVVGHAAQLSNSLSMSSRRREHPTASSRDGVRCRAAPQAAYITKTPSVGVPGSARRRR